MLPKIIAIVGPTGSGKSALAIKLAKLARKFFLNGNGEVVSADARQIYKGLDIGTEKLGRRARQNIPHHLLDVVDPKKTFTVADYQKLADRTIQNILRRGKLPIICGGSGFYVAAALNQIIFPTVKPNRELRTKLERLTASELYSKLRMIDPRRAANIDRHNPRRLIRAIEIVRAAGRVPPPAQPIKKYDVLIIGLNPPLVKLKKRLRTRLRSALKRGLLAEVKTLRRHGLSWRRLNELGLEYRFAALHLLGKINKIEMLEKTDTALWHYAKRQLAWFKRDKEIKWLNLDVERQAIKLMNDFLKNR